MTPAIAENGSVLINRIAYKIKAPKKGDVVAFMPKGNTSANYNVKRIVAVPGDTVLISNGRLYVNDKVVNLKQSDDKSIKDEGRAVTEITLGKNEYFVLGDNVNNSEDSRYGSIGKGKHQKDELYLADLLRYSKIYRYRRILTIPCPQTSCIQMGHLFHNGHLF